MCFQFFGIIKYILSFHSVDTQQRGKVPIFQGPGIHFFRIWVLIFQGTGVRGTSFPAMHYNKLLPLFYYNFILVISVYNACVVSDSFLHLIINPKFYKLVMGEQR